MTAIQKIILGALCLPALVFAKSNVVGFDENLNDSYIALGDVTHVSARVTQTFTVETWVKPASFQSWGGLIGAFQDNGSTEHGWVLGTSWSNRFSFGLATQGGDGLTYLRSDSSTCASFDVDTWYHVAGVYDGAQMQLYVNGTLCNTSTAQSGAIDYPPSADFVLGMYKDDDEHNALDGQMAETRLWNVAKTAQELKDAMNTRLTGDEAGLTGYWPLNEGSGTTTADKSTQPLTGQLSQVTWGTSYLPVIDALPAIQTPVDINVLALDTEYVHLGDVSAVSGLITKAFTVESWVKPNSFQYWGGILGAFQDNGSTEHGWVLGTSWSNQFSFAVASENGNGLTYLRTGGDNCGSFDVDTWHHVAGVYDGSQMQLYVDGILCNTSTAQSGDIDYPPTADFVLGAYKDNDEQNIFDGQISDTRMWDEARSKQQIRDSMGLRLTGTERGLVGYWPLDENSGTVIVDKSISQMHAQLGQITRTTANLRLTDLVLTTNPTPATGWRTQGPLILSPDGKPFTIKAINWFGFQTQRNIVHALWEVDYLSQLDKIKALGFNTIRLPYANTTLATNAKVTGYLANGNSDFIEDVTPALLAMDIFIYAAGSRGLYVILDRHSMQADITDPPQWYKDEVSESHWLRDSA
ncbi:MAG: cellulase family glycosylhydrolase, partial [Psychrosphaera sp.]|nr:cellulase family glycosylhydrolase [Psychrosphaera sp.]